MVVTEILCRRRRQTRIFVSDVMRSEFSVAAMGIAAAIVPLIYCGVRGRQEWRPSIVAVFMSTSVLSRFTV